MTIIYRILSAFINVIALMLTISLVFSIPMIISSPLTLLSAFIMIAVILYSWFSFRFRREVLQQQKMVPHSLRDWVRVNGIVTLIFSALTILNVLFLLKNPQAFADVFKNYGVEMPVQNIMGFFYVMLFYAVVLAVHIIWTFTLMKKYRNFFQ